MDFDTARRLVFDSYIAALPQAQSVVESRDGLAQFLGDVDQQAGSMDMAVRMQLAGRVFAASVALAGGDPPPLDQVTGLIEARLTYGRAQREQAAPLADGRLDPEDEAESGLGELIAEADDDDLAEECATVASYLLQFGLQARADIDAWLVVGEEVRDLALEGQAALDITGAFGLAGEGPGALLSRAAANARSLEESWSRVGTGGRPRRNSITTRETWIQMAAALVAVRARWIGYQVDWNPAIARATERIASSHVMEHPSDFAAQACAEHALTVVLDAATAWLDDALAPTDPPEDAREFIWEGLLEAASSGLVGAWVEAQADQA